MVPVETETTTLEGVTFVRALVTNTRTTPQVVRLESTLPGPVWPPQNGREDAAEWDGAAWEGIVDAGRCRGVGFATPAEQADADDEAAMRLVSTSRASPDRLEGTADETLSKLDEWVPTNDVVSGER